MTSRRIVFVALAAAVPLTASPVAQQPLGPVASIAMPGVTGRIDHLAIDRANNRLFVAALGHDTVEVIDLRSHADVQSASGFGEPQGIVFLPPANQVAVANGGTGDVQFRAADDLHLVGRVALGQDADNVRYDAAATRVYVAYGRALAAIDGRSLRRVAEVPLAAHPEAFQLDGASARIYVNVPGARHIAVVDRATMREIDKWPITAADANYPMAIDDTGRFLFVGCRRPARVLVIDTQSGKAVSVFDTVGDTDDLFFDAQRRRLYVIGGEGFVDIFSVRAPALSHIARVPTAPGARTGLFVPEQQRLYVAVPARGAQQAEIRIFEARQ